MSDIVVAIIAGLFSLLAIVAQQLLSRARKDMAVVKEQVANSHGTNLRDDIDEAILLLRHVANTQADHGRQLSAHGDAILNLRTDLTWERRERMDLARVMTGKEPFA